MAAIANQEKRGVNAALFFFSKSSESPQQV
jgi:hypothetical protein